MLMSMLTASALAGTPAHYHPDSVAGSSEVFRASAEELAPAFDAAQTSLASLGRDLEGLEVGVALLGDTAPGALSQWSQTAQETVTVQYLTVQHHVNAIQDGYGQVFGGALQRAIDAQPGYTIVECASGGGLSAMMGRRSGSGSCEGEDLNPALTTALDADATLRSELTELTGVAWPEIGLEAQQQPAVAITGTGRDVDVATLADALIGNLLDSRLEDFEDALAPLEDDIDEGSESTIAEAAELKRTYEARLATDGAALITAVSEALARAGKKNNTDNIGLCANPTGLGGCGGDDATAAVLDLIRDDRKLAKAITRINES